MLNIKPLRKVLGSMLQQDAEGSPVLVGLKAESAGSDTLKIMIDVVFQAVPLERPLLKGYWYFGSTGADITLQSLGADIVRHTEGSEITVKHKIKRGKDKTVSAKLAPGVEFGDEVKISVGEVGVEGKTAAEEEAEYESKENPLAVIDIGDSVIWKQSMARGEQAVRDYLFSTLKLYAECNWGEKKSQGNVRLRNKTFFFDKDDRRLPDWKALLMEATLKFRKYKIPNRDGIELNFTYTKS